MNTSIHIARETTPKLQLRLTTIMQVLKQEESMEVMEKADFFSRYHTGHGTVTSTNEEYWYVILAHSTNNKN